MSKLNPDQCAIVSDLAAASHILIAARKRATKNSDLQKMIAGIHDQLDLLAYRICGYKFDEVGKHDPSEVKHA